MNASKRQTGIAYSGAPWTLRARMILIGTMNWASTRMRGTFHCPNCDSNQDFRLRASRPFLTIYFIPILPIGGLQEYVQCNACKNSFESIILADRMMPGDIPTTQTSSLGTSTFEDDLLKAIALIMIEDGNVTENEISVARLLYKNITLQNITRDELGAACSHVRLNRLNTLSFLATAGPRCSHEQKLLLVQAMFGIASADGEVSSGRMKSLLKTQQILGLEEREFESAIQATEQWLS